MSETIGRFLGCRCISLGSGCSRFLQPCCILFFLFGLYYSLHGVFGCHGDTRIAVMYVEWVVVDMTALSKVTERNEELLRYLYSVLGIRGK